MKRVGMLEITHPGEIEVLGDHGLGHVGAHRPAVPEVDVAKHAHGLRSRRRLVHAPTVGLVGTIGGGSLVACSYFSVKFPEEKLRTVFAAFLALSSALMIRSSLPLRMIKWKP